MSYTQTELLKKEFKSSDKSIFGGTLRPGLYVLAGGSKVGKSLIATSLANHLALGIDYLGKSMPKGKVIYFDNDNYDFETKSRVLALNFEDNDDVIYEFEKARSIYDIKNYLDNLENIDEYKLVIIDSYINLEEVAATNDNYNDIYPLVIELRDSIVKHNLVGVVSHHIRKESGKHDQDCVIGSKALTGACTGTILLSVGNEFSRVGKLKLILRNHKSVIDIKKDDQNINWILDEEKTTSEEIPKNILCIINATVRSDRHKIEGTCQEIAQRSGIDINPNSLSRYLKDNINYLEENHIVFTLKRTSNKRLMVFEYKPNDSNDRNDS